MSNDNYDDFDDTFEDDADGAEESNNRTFLFVAGGLGVVILIVLLCVVGYVFFNYNSSQANQITAQAQATQQEAIVQSALTSTAVEMQAQAEAATSTVTPTNTPVIAEAIISRASPRIFAQGI